MPSSLQKIIRGRAIAKTLKERSQVPLLAENDVFHASMVSKLTPFYDTKQFLNFQRCGREEIYRRCATCKSGEWLTYRCNIKWCPRCQWRLAEKRKELIVQYASQIYQPKHLVLTQRNFSILTRKKIREHQRNLAKLRRTKCFEKVRGGCVSVEITNEEKGWHLHSHWLVNCRWIDHEELKHTWAGIVGQEFAIVRIYDARDKDYVRELCKYVVEGSEAARWKPELLHEFVRAVRGCRFFFSFGELQKLAPAIRAQLKLNSAHSCVCDCGSEKFGFKVLKHDETIDQRQAYIKRQRAGDMPCKPHMDELKMQKDLKLTES